MFDRLFGGGIADQNGIRNILFETALLHSLHSLHSLHRPFGWWERLCLVTLVAENQMFPLGPETGTL
jgi:hypothetical protein